MLVFDLLLHGFELEFGLLDLRLKLRAHDHLFVLTHFLHFRFEKLVDQICHLNSHDFHFVLRVQNVLIRLLWFLKRQLLPRLRLVVYLVIYRGGCFGLKILAILL